MENLSFEGLQLTNLNESKIRVRLSRKWRNTSTNNRSDSGIHIILIDQFEKRMHALITPSLIPIYEEKLIVNEKYEISNFQVTPYTGKFKCFDAATQIIFTPLSVLNTFEDNSCHIEKNVFHFTEFCNLESAVEQDAHLIDIVGIIDNFQPIKHVMVTTHGEEMYLEFVVTDLINKIKVTLWNELGTQFENAFEQPFQHPPIIIISSCQVRRYEKNGEIQVTNRPATTFLLNPNIDHVAELRDRYWQLLPYI